MKKIRRTNRKNRAGNRNHHKLADIRAWVQEPGSEWTEEDIATIASLLAGGTATVWCDLRHPDFARALYRMNRLRGVSREATLTGMSAEFAPDVLAYVMANETA